MSNQFKGRSLAVIDDFSLDERLYLFEKAKELKKHIFDRNRAELEKYRINDSDFGVYEVFIEDSTRTKESFKNAAEFHRVKLSNLEANHSSINKSESFADTFNTLCGYDNLVFIVRSKQEGLCRWLEENGRLYAERNRMKQTPSFINAGDGKHEHPTQELLDEFTFLERNKWDRNSFHTALVGDLYHGRTVHSKADGLTIFKNVKIDLVAPRELGMPEYYIDKMKESGFEVNIFDSIDSYMESGQTAPVWYFTRPQLERMGDDILKRQDELRYKITFRKEFLEKIPEGTIFYHPLPRHKLYPTIPTYLDDTPLNGWEEQSANGMIIRIILLGLVAGVIGSDYKSETIRRIKPEDTEDFIEELPLKETLAIKDYAEGVKPISNGIVIDHICRGESEKEIREHLARIIRVLELYGKGGEWISRSRSEENKMKGIIFRPGLPEPGTKKMKQLAALAPGCTVNIIKERKVIKKLKLRMPPRIYNFPNICCRNSDCISHSSQGEHVPAEFNRITGDKFRCKYCEKPHTFKEIWIQ
ncbi:MAG: aspartate carbamoyltransferase [Spirochaetia bacterium]|jgi:aspartate carbamoyltransferase|nr:aspartate carbamoyltransferase [Spirochaetia bacterium]